MITQEYRDNRAQFPRSDLAKYGGSWVAFSADGRRIVASGETIEQRVGGASGQVVFEWVPGPDEDCVLGAEKWQ